MNRQASACRAVVEAPVIIVDQEKCTGCGVCAFICHEQCITIIQNNGDKRAAVNQELCSTCTQCVAICPSQALSWGQVRSAAFEKEHLPSPDQLDELFKQRRTIRRFKKRQLDRGLITEVTSYAAYAPTNNYHLRLLVVDDPILLETLYAVTRRAAALAYNLLYRSEVIFRLLSALTPEVNLKNRIKIKRGVEDGESLEQPPPVMVFVVGDRRVLLSEASAQYALYNMILSAQVRRIGSRINAAGQVILDRNRAVRRRLGLGKHEHILGAVELGYPGVRFRNKVEGKAMPLQWNEGARDG